MDKAQRNEYARKWRQTEKGKAYYRRYKQLTKEKHKLYVRCWRERKLGKVWKGRDREGGRKYFSLEQKKESIKKLQQKAYHKRKLNASYRVSRNISRQIRLALFSGTNKSGNKWQNKTGYSLLELKKHLERQFNKKMCWENYGTYWQIDHRIPQSKFNQLNEAEFKMCWSLENLRPLETRANIVKSNRFAEPTLNQIILANIARED